VAIIAIGYVVVNGLVDVLYAVLDPRIRRVRSTDDPPASSEPITLEPVPLAAPVDVSRTRRLGITGYLATGGWLSSRSSQSRCRGCRSTARQAVRAEGGPHAQRTRVPGHLLGGDTIGRDLFARVLWGTRYRWHWHRIRAAGSLVGGALGLIAGFYRGRIDTVLSAVFNTLLAIPRSYWPSRS